MVRSLSGLHFTHITIRYSDLRLFPHSSCQTRQETARKEVNSLVSLCFGPLGGPHQWLPVKKYILAYFLRLSTPNFS